MKTISPYRFLSRLFPPPTGDLFLRRPVAFWHTCGFVLVAVASLTTLAHPVQADQFKAVAALSLEDLLQQPVVTASRREQSMSDAPMTMYVITEKEIRESPAFTLSDLLRRVPGFQTKTWLSEFTNTSIRGMVGASVINERIMWMLDGVPINDVRDGGIWTDITLPLSNIKRIEILSGPGSALYGSNAFLGVVHIITRDAQDFLDQGKTGEARTAWSSFRTWMNALTVAGRSRQADWLWNLELNQTDGPGIVRDRNRPGEDAHSDRAWGYLFGKYQFGEHRLNVGARQVNQEYDGADFAFYRLYKWRRGENWIDWHWRHERPSGSRDTLILSWHRFTEEFRDFADVPGLDYDIDSHRWYLSWQRDLPIRSRHQVSFGTGLRWEAYEGNDFYPDHRSIRKSNGNLFLQDEIDLAKDWILTVGGRFDTHSSYEDVFSPHASLVRTFNGGRGHVRLAGGRAFKEPSNWQSFIDQPSGRGTLNMGPERITTFEASVDYSFPRHLFSRLTAFRMRHSNIIWENFDATIADPAYARYGILGKFHPQQLGGDARIEGLELDVRKHFSPRNRGFLTWMHLRSRDDQGRTMQYDAQNKASAGFWHAFDRRCSLALESHWVDDTIDTNVPALGRRPVSDYVVTGAALQMKLSDREQAKVSVWNWNRSPYEEMLGAWAPGTQLRFEYTRQF